MSFTPCGNTFDKPAIFNAKILTSLFVAVLNQANQKFVRNFNLIRLFDNERHNFGGNFFGNKRGVYLVDELNFQFVLNGVTNRLLLFERQEAENFLEVVVSELVFPDARLDLFENVLRVHWAVIFFSNARQPLKISS